MTITANTPVGEIATAHPLATRVFARHNIDFCCGGGRPLEEACAAKDAALDTVMAELAVEIDQEPGDQMNWSGEPLPSLIDHILLTYHKPLTEELPRIDAMARKVHSVHGEKDPQRFAAIADTFGTLMVDLQNHMMKEEEILFPMIREGQGAGGQGPILVMEEEHVAAGQMLARLRELTDDYQAPAEACNTWRALWAGLADLERSLHEHIHLENNILFPRALAG
jgi:regulator of cell morphogenesis and NO signaling